MKPHKLSLKIIAFALGLLQPTSADAEHLIKNLYNHSIHGRLLDNLQIDERTESTARFPVLVKVYKIGNLIVKAYHYIASERHTKGGAVTYVFASYPQWYVIREGTQEEVYWDRSPDGLNGNEYMLK